MTATGTDDGWILVCDVRGGAGGPNFGGLGYGCGPRLCDQHITVSNEPRLSRARGTAAAQGWQYTDLRDWCPHHRLPEET